MATATVRTLVRAIALVLLSALLGSVGATERTSKRVRFPHSVRGTLPTGTPASQQHAIVTGALSDREMGSKRLEVELALPMRDFPDLQRRIARGELISRGDMVEKYFPREADYGPVAGWLAAQGLTITYKDANRLSVFAEGTMQQLAQAFETEFGRVSFDGGEFISAITVPSVPPEIAPALIAINGLQPHLRMHPHVKASPFRRSAAPANSTGYKPAQVAMAYGATGLNVTGAGEIIAVVIDAFPDVSDVTAFWRDSGVNRPANSLALIPVDAGPRANGSNLLGEMEATLDVEWSGAMAPGAALRVYGLRALTSTAINHACARIYADAQTLPGLHQVSMSFGGLEYT